MFKIWVICVLLCEFAQIHCLEYVDNGQYDSGNPVSQKQLCTPCNQNPWIPITSYHNKNKVIAYVHPKFYDQQNKEYGMKNLRQYFPKLEYPKPNLLPPSSQVLYSNNNNNNYLLPRPTNNVKLNNQQHFVKQDYYVPQSSNIINNVQLNQHIAFQQPQHPDLVKYRAFISKALPPRINYGPPFRATLNYQKMQLTNLNQLMPPPQEVNFNYQLPLNMEPPNIIQNTVFDNSPQPTRFYNVETSSVQTRNVEIIKSVPVIDYLATVEHPINTIYSPILDVDVANSSSIAADDNEDDEHFAASNVNTAFQSNVNDLNVNEDRKQEPPKKKEELRIPFSIQDLLMHKGALMAPKKYETNSQAENDKKVIITPRKPNKIQIIIPYITNNSKLQKWKETEKDTVVLKEATNVDHLKPYEDTFTTETSADLLNTPTIYDIQNISQESTETPEVRTSKEEVLYEINTEINSIQNAFFESQYLSTQVTPRLAPPNAASKENVYVVTPLPMDTFNASYLNVPNENTSVSEKRNVSLILSDWPHLINNLETSRIEHTTKPSYFGVPAPVFLSTYKNKIKTFSGHSKVLNTTPVFFHN
ncbi:PREDICTED: uncharacterized protein LOC108564666 [Nicrophorus vespilloides]|uniref:Uncharacterized protein LOC108564666 n=1 Tax=Nicrophorus vespilloides TaxID=110193 RepID=A0ABM1MXE3_NICVS|nr:PREDICTED: uncharacterized protein LOC108564666 [Nicrophorus vespilloides]